MFYPVGKEKWRLMVSPMKVYSCKKMSIMQVISRDNGLKQKKDLYSFL